MDLSSLKQKFIYEAEDLLTSLDNTLIELEKNYMNKPLIDEAFRVMHTIKGASGMFGYDKIVDITHELESLYDSVREGMSKADEGLIDISFAAADHIRALLKDETCSDETNIQQHFALKNNIDAYKESGMGQVVSVKMPKLLENSDMSIETWHILFYPSDEIIKRGVNLAYTFHDLFILGDYRISNHPCQVDNEQYWSIFLVTDKGYGQIEEALLFIMDYCKIYLVAGYNLFDPVEFEKRKEISDNTQELQEMYQAVVPEESTVSDKKYVIDQDRAQVSLIPVNHKTNRVNVDAAKLDSLMYLVSELVTSKSELLNALGKKDITRSLDAGEKIEKLSKMFSENALNLRLVSISEIIEKFKRYIRDLAKQLGKQINFVTIGGDTELDKSIIDHIGEPIMHLVRNCVDHGIETPAVRKSHGKPETGTVKFGTRKTGNYVYIDISDDGGGIDTENVYRKAVEKGFINAGAQLTDKEIYDLLFLPGFSTAQNLSNISGRGVGMDIVQKKIQEVRGEITVTSGKNTGTSFRIKLQQTISIIDTLLINATGVTYAIPLDDIDSCILEPLENLIDKHNHLVNLNGNLVPYMYIEKPDISEDYTTGATRKLIIIKKHDKTFALVADNIIGEYQAVIKPIGPAFNQIKFLSGASLLGDGSIALLVDTDKLTSQFAEQFI